MTLTNSNPNYVVEIKEILSNARKRAYSAVNSAMVEAYWNIGKRIVEEEQDGKERAEYGKEIIKKLSKELTTEFGKGFSERTLWEIKQFYLIFIDFEKLRTVCAVLKWSHIKLIMRVSNKDAQQWYIKEAAEQNWSVRTLDRNISTLYYQRLLSSQEKDSVQNEMKQNTQEFQNDSFEFIKKPVETQCIASLLVFLFF